MNFTTLKSLIKLAQLGLESVHQKLERFVEAEFESLCTTHPEEESEESPSFLETFQNWD